MVVKDLLTITEVPQGRAILSISTVVEAPVIVIRVDDPDPVSRGGASIALDMEGALVLFHTLGERIREKTSGD